MATINVINRKLKSLNNALLDAYNNKTTVPIPAAYLRQVLTYVGLKEGFRFANAFLTLTQDVNPDFEDPIDRNDKTKIKNFSKAAYVFGTSHLLHDRPISGGIQENSNYDYAGKSVSNIVENEVIELNYAALIGCNPVVNQTSSSEPIGEHLAKVFCGRELNGDYPYRYFSSGAPYALWNLANTLEGKEGPYGTWTKSLYSFLQTVGMDIQNGISFTDPVDVANIVAVINKPTADAFEEAAGAADLITAIAAAEITGDIIEEATLDPEVNNVTINNITNEFITNVTETADTRSLIGLQIIGF